MWPLSEIQQRIRGNLCEGVETANAWRALVTTTRRQCLLPCMNAHTHSPDFQNTFSDCFRNQSSTVVPAGSSPSSRHHSAQNENGHEIMDDSAHGGELRLRSKRLGGAVHRQYEPGRPVGSICPERMSRIDDLRSQLHISSDGLQRRGRNAWEKMASALLTSSAACHHHRRLRLLCSDDSSHLLGDKRDGHRILPP